MMFKKFKENHPYLYEIIFTIVISIIVITIFPFFNLSINKNGIYPVLALLSVRLWTVRKERKE